MTVDLAELLIQPGGKRAKWLRDAADQDLPPKGAAALAAAGTAGGGAAGARKKGRRGKRGAGEDEGMGRLW